MLPPLPYNAATPCVFPYGTMPPPLYRTTRPPLYRTMRPPVQCHGATRTVPWGHPYRAMRPPLPYHAPYHAATPTVPCGHPPTVPCIHPYRTMPPPPHRTMWPPIQATVRRSLFRFSFFLFFSVARRHPRKGPPCSFAALRFRAVLICDMNPQRNDKPCCPQKID